MTILPSPFTETGLLVSFSLILELPNVHNPNRHSINDYAAYACQRLKIRFTTLSVNIISIAVINEAAIEVVDPQPIDLGYERIEYHRMTAADYVLDRSG